MKPFICSLAALLPGGGGCPGTYFPLNTPCASGEKTTFEIPCRAQAGNTVSSGLRHSIEYCGWLELNNHFFFFTDKEMADATVKLFQS